MAHVDTTCAERHYDEGDTAFANFLGYVVLRVMTEGVVHMIVYHH